MTTKTLKQGLLLGASAVAFALMLPMAAQAAEVDIDTGVTTGNVNVGGTVGTPGNQAPGNAGNGGAGTAGNNGTLGDNTLLEIGVEITGAGNVTPQGPGSVTGGIGGEGQAGGAGLSLVAEAQNGGNGGNGNTGAAGINAAGTGTVTLQVDAIGGRGGHGGAGGAGVNGGNGGSGGNGGTGATGLNTATAQRIFVDANVRGGDGGNGGAVGAGGGAPVVGNRGSGGTAIVANNAGAWLTIGENQVIRGGNTGTGVDGGATGGMAVDIQAGRADLRGGANGSSYYTGALNDNTDSSQTTAIRINAAADNASILTFSGVNTIGSGAANLNGERGDVIVAGANAANRAVVSLGGISNIHEDNDILTAINLTSQSTTGRTSWGTSEVVNTTVHGNFSVTDSRMIVGLGRDQTRTGRVTLATADGFANSAVTITDTEIRPHVTDRTTGNGQMYVLASGVGAGAATVNTNTFQTTTAAYSTDSSFQTIVRTYSAGVGAAGNFAGNDRFGVAITGNDAVLRIDIASGNSITADRSNGQAVAFDVAANQDSLALNLVSLNQAVQNLNQVDLVRQAADQLRPEVSGATTQAAQNAVSGTIGTIEHRTQSLRFNTLGLTGLAAGESGTDRGVGMWVQGFGTSGVQQARNGFTGYGVRTGGVAIGSDVEVMDGLRLGVAFAYARGTVKERGHRSGNDLTSDSYIGSLYGSYNHEHFYIDTTLTAGRHNYDHTRKVTLPNYVQTAKAEYNANQFGAKVEAGVPVVVAEGVFVTPLANIAYNHTSIDSYTETGAAGANLTVNSRTVNSTRLGAGVTLAANLGGGDGVSFTPSARVLYTREVGTRDHNTTARYVEGTQTFTVSGAKPERNAVQLGLGLDMGVGNNLTVSAAYDAELRVGYTGHSGLLRLRYDF